jgi:hypothetical protein
MTTETLKGLVGISDGDYSELSALEFEEICSEHLSFFGKVERQVRVDNRGDGHAGRIDLVFHYNGQLIPIEIDRKSPRKKSVYKVLQYNADNAFCITRSPFEVHKITRNNHPHQLCIKL